MTRVYEVGRDERGFTLVELVIGIAILGTIVGGLAGAIIVGLRTADATATRLAQSHDAQLVSVYLPRDLASTSSDVVAKPDPDSMCSSQGTLLLRLRWTDEADYVATYRMEQAPTGEWELIRHLCVDGGAPTSVVVAHDLGDPSDQSVVKNLPQISVSLKELPEGPGDPPYEYTLLGNCRSCA